MRDPHTSTLARLRARLARLYTLADETLSIPGAPCPYTIALPASPDDPLDRFAAGSGPARASASSAQQMSLRDLSAVALAAGQARLAVAAGVHMPYWALLWPSGLALAEALLAEREAIRGRRALELGCGLGMTATAALGVGARLTAADCYAEALLFTRYNALRTAGRAPRTLLLDWRSEAGRAACLAAGPFDLLLAADVLYETENVAPLLGLVPRLLVPGGAFWLAEPGRRVSLAFVAAARDAGWRDRETIFERDWPPDGDEARVAVHRFTLPD